MACGSWLVARACGSCLWLVLVARRYQPIFYRALLLSYLEHLRTVLEAHRRHLLLAQREHPYHLLDVLDLVTVDGAAACGGAAYHGDEAPDALPHLVVGSAWLYRLHATSDRQRQNPSATRSPGGEGDGGEGGGGEGGGGEGGGGVAASPTRLTPEQDCTKSTKGLVQQPQGGKRVTSVITQRTPTHQAPSLGVVIELLLRRGRALLQAAEEILGEVLRHVAKLVVVVAGRALHHPFEALDGALGQVADCTSSEP